MFSVRTVVLVLLIVGSAVPSRAQDAPLIAVGDDAVDAARLAPGTQHYRLVRLTKGEEQQIGVVQATLTPYTDARGRKGLLYLFAQQTTRATMTDSLFLNPETLEPYWYRNHAPGFQYIAVDYAPDHHVTGVHEFKDQPTRTIDEQMDGPRFDFTFYGELVRTLPLAEGFAARLPVFHYAEGTAFVTAQVTGSETFEEGDHETRAWLVEITSPGGLDAMIDGFVIPLLPLLKERYPNLTVTVSSSVPRTTLV